MSGLSLTPRSRPRRSIRRPHPRWLLLGAGALLAAAGCYEPREAPPAAQPDCTTCHGDGDLAAPPPGVWLAGGKTATTYRGVGAHRIHLRPGTLSAAVPCSTCHRVPTRVDDPGHLDSALPAEVTFGGLALARGTDASWDGERCTVYCHQGKLPGGSLTRPEWTQVKGDPLPCGACHGFPPVGSHPARMDCADCHGEVIDARMQIVAPALHIDGMVSTK